MFMELLDKINLKDTDMLYILGDVLDRGPYPIKTLIPNPLFTEIEG